MKFVSEVGSYALDEMFYHFLLDGVVGFLVVVVVVELVQRCDRFRSHFNAKIVTHHKQSVADCRKNAGCFFL